MIDGYYFRTRALPPDLAPVDWTQRIDPDGNLRDHTKERELKVADAREAIAFLEDHCASVVDIGCGLGFILAALHPHDVGKRIGVEPDERSRAYAQSLGLDVLSNASEIGTFACDGALSWNVLEHVEERAHFTTGRGPLGYLSEAARIVKPGGWLVLQTPNFESETARAWGERYRMLHDPTHVSLFGETGLRRALRDTGWLVREMRHDFYGTRFNTPANNARLSDEGHGMSPSAIGNVMTAYAQRADTSQASKLLRMGEIERSL